MTAWGHADPVGGLVGGALIGISTALMLLGAGRIAGISGIMARSLGLGRGTMPLSSGWIFLLGLPLGAWLVQAMLDRTPAQLATSPTLLLAGVLVGFGARLGSGCTSGHGVCGVSRLSARSLVATAMFIAAGIATVAVMRMAGLAA